MKKFLLLLCMFLFSTLQAALTSTSPLQLSVGFGNVAPKIAVNARGDAAAVWGNNYSGDVIVATFNHATFAWSSPISIGLGGSATVGIDQNGNAMVLWLNGNLQVIQTARFAYATQNWSVPLTISAVGFNSSPAIAVAANGNAIAVWLFGAVPLVVAADYSVTTNTWSVPITITPDASATPQVGIDQNGNGIVVWQILNTGFIQSSYLLRH